MSISRHLKFKRFSSLRFSFSSERRPDWKSEGRKTQLAEPEIIFFSFLEFFVTMTIFCVNGRGVQHVFGSEAQKSTAQHRFFVVFSLLAQLSLYLGYRFVCKYFVLCLTLILKKCRWAWAFRKWFMVPCIKLEHIYDHICHLISMPLASFCINISLGGPVVDFFSN